MDAPKVAKLKKIIAGAAKRVGREILPKPERRGWRDMGPFRSVSNIATDYGGTPRKKDCSPEMAIGKILSLPVSWTETAGDTDFMRPEG